MRSFERSLQFAKELDLADPLAHFREMFHYPESVIYFCGNSLGLQPKKVRTEIEAILKTWEELGVEGWFHGSKNWFSYSDSLVKSMARIIGAQPEEVSIMNSLTVNLHLLLVSFYRPSNRHRILIEEHAFPSDQYALKSQIRFHGYDVNDSLIEVKAKAGEHKLRTEDIIEAIDESIALVLFSGVNYLTGQAFDMEAITKAAHERGCVVGFDLAHAVGNIPLKLHDWNVDFAIWCNYKYLNAGPGGIGACFIHKNHFKGKELPRFDGWWGGNRSTMFLMEPDINPALGASGWQLSTHPVLLLASLKAALDIWDRLDLSLFHQKRELLTGYLEYLIKELGPENYEIITPSKAYERGCQLSIRTLKKGKELFNILIERGVTLDWREPDVIRVAPYPLYNTFEEVYKFAEILAEAVQ
jgi:kynureninase